MVVFCILNSALHMGILSTSTLVRNLFFALIYLLMNSCDSGYNDERVFVYPH